MRENVLGRLAVPLAVPWAERGASALARFIEAERGRFLPWLPVFMGIGIVIFFSCRAEPRPWIGPAVLLAAVPLAALGWRHQIGRACGLMVLALALGFASASLRTHALPPMPDLPRGAVLVSGRIVAVEPLPTGRRVVLGHVTLDGGRPLARDVRVRLRGTDRQPLAPGDRMAVRALLRPPFAPAYPGAWDLRRDEYFQGLAGGGFALGAARRLAAAPRSGRAEHWQRFREAVAARIMAVLPGPPGAVAATLLTGMNTAIPNADRAAFAAAGLAHILAVAGLHIGIIMSTVFAVVRFGLVQWEWGALRFPLKQIAGVAALGAGAFYMAITGMHLPIIRSFLMACLVTLGLLIGRRAISMRGLGFAATVLMLTQPEAVAGVSFQMSFAAVMVLVAGYEAMRSLRIASVSHQPGVWGWLRRDLTLVATTSILAAAATAPFVAYHFGQVQLYSVFANMLAVPLATFWVLPLGLLALLLMPIGCGFLALIPMGWGCALMIGIARMAAALPGAAISVPPESLTGLCIAILGLTWLCLWRSPVRLAGLAPLVLGVFVMPLFVTVPDILVAPDLRIIAVREPHAVYLLQKGHDDFTFGEWRRFFGDRPVVALPALGVACSGEGCVLPGRRDGGSILLWQAWEPPADCRGIAVVIALGYLHGMDGPNCAGVTLVDRDRVQAAQAITVRLARGGVVVRADRDGRGTWPWLPPPVR
ncbi:MAG: ComEC family competence protein [Proteobacteria bacterium]|nr:ComEC family competence protein [Pseudomonadota bacterium]